MWQRKNAIAGKIRNVILKNSDKLFYFMDSIDDRYCSHYILHSFLRALEKEAAGKVVVDKELPCFQKN